jgi:type IV pilus assembly protein PilY1
MMSTIPVAAGLPLRIASRLAIALCSLAVVSVPARAQTPLANAPILATRSVPGNVALPLSVEWPTTQRTAHVSAYDSGPEFLGYFDPKKCYEYHYDSTDTAVRPNPNPTNLDDLSKVTYFQPSGFATNHVCVGKWSGNFLNWAATPTIDPFRWALTGGFRVVDRTTRTVLEKAWADTHTGLYPDKTIAGALVPGATPFNFASLSIRIRGLGNKMRFTGTGNLGAAPTAYDGSGGTVEGTTYEAFARVRVCDPTSATGPNGENGNEGNCVQYGVNWKPEGLIQQYANKMRFSVFGYLNDDTATRDGGVLRARQKFVGPTRPVPGSVAVVNAGKEWDAATGIFFLNPDKTDADNTNLAFTPTTDVVNSGVMNYLNKFGEIAPSSTYTFKSYDPVSELYYAAVRYFKNLGNVPSYTDMSAGDAATRTTWIDGFPVITDWTGTGKDPIQYSCQRNFILGIGDIYTWNDKNLPGSGTGTTTEPGKPGAVSGDASVDAVIATDKVFSLESLGAPNRNNYSGRNNSAGIAGLAYDSHTKDIRPDLDDMQTIDTYWVDVLEQPFVANNQFYLAAKYGGFTVPKGYDPYGNTTPLTQAWWHTATGSPDTNYVGAQLRPDNYFTGGRPDLMVAGLNAAFSKIASSLTAYTTSFSTSLPQLAQTGNASYSSQYDGVNWTGELTASTLSFAAATDNASLTEKWRFTDRLAVQLAAAGAHLTNRRIVSWGGSSGVQFCSGTANCTVPLTGAQLTALDPSYVTGDDSADYLNYLRGDQTNEEGGGTKAYRARTKLLGDIVGSKARPVGPPSFPFSDAANPGYSAFKSNTTIAARPTVVYVGANDGMMHAIRGDLTAVGGEELFAYVPGALFQGPNGTRNVDGLASLGNPSFVHHFMVDATPNVYDVDFGRTGGPAAGALDWRSILIGGLGKGGKSYYAIDVTDPVGMSANEATVASKVLWEFTDPDLGYTYGDPIVVKTLKYGWVVIVPSGYNNTNGKGYFFIINPKTGVLLEKISTGVGAPTAAGSAGLAFANAFVLDGTDGTIDAVYAGDLLGNLWRWDVTATTGLYPPPLKMATLTDAETGGNPQPVTSRPMIEVHPTLKKRFVLVGTGRLLDSPDIGDTQVQSFYSIMDGTNARFNQPANLPTGINFPITRSVLVANTNAVTTGAPYSAARPMGWVEDVDVAGDLGWRVITDSTTLLGSVAWATTLPSVADPCKPAGKGRVYARDFGTGISTILTSGTTSAVSYIDSANAVTDLHYLSVDGKATLLGGTSKGETPKYDTSPLSTLPLRRLNWRELQTVE